MQRTKQGFFNMCGFPGIVGAIDCTNIKIVKPDSGIEHAYKSFRRACHTKNVQMVNLIEFNFFVKC